MRWTRSMREAIWDPRKGPLAFVIIGYALSVSTNVISADIADRSLRWWIFAVVVPLGVLALILSPMFARIFPQVDREPVSVLRRRARKYPVFVGIASQGKGISAMRSAIGYHHPTWVFLIHSDASKADAETLFSELTAKGPDGILNAENFRLLHIGDDRFDDPESIRELIEKRVFGDLPEGMSEEDVMIDITGGSKGATAGAFLAGLADNRNLEVMLAKTKDADGRAQEADVPAEIDISYKVKKAGRR